MTMPARSGRVSMSARSSTARNFWRGPRSADRQERRASAASRRARLAAFLNSIGQGCRMGSFPPGAPRNILEERAFFEFRPPGGMLYIRHGHAKSGKNVNGKPGATAVNQEVRRAGLVTRATREFSRLPSETGMEYIRMGCFHGRKETHHQDCSPVPNTQIP